MNRPTSMSYPVSSFLSFRYVTGGRLPLVAAMSWPRALIAGRSAAKAGDGRSVGASTSARSSAVRVLMRGLLSAQILAPPRGLAAPPHPQAQRPRRDRILLA